MAINVVVAVTDYDWFVTLKQLPDLSEANFWAPSPRNFQALQPGELCLFKLHAPYDMIVGGGIFAYANIFPCSLAWEIFREANGAYSLGQMRERIIKYRKTDASYPSDFSIGCRILTQTFFLDEPDWIRPPKSWAKNIVTFKTYNTTDEEGLYLWQAAHAHMSDRPRQQLAEIRVPYGEPTHGNPTLVSPRLGQGAFRVVVTDTYHRRCAVTNERTLPALDAAHIFPYHMGGDHVISNGLLLRRDIHSLFDAGYVTVTPSWDFEVSGAIREEFENGRDYYALHGKRIHVPDHPDQHPDPAALAWHNENIFKG